MNTGHKFTGVSENTPESIQIGAGVFCYDITPPDKKPTFKEIVDIVEKAKTDGKILGATRGGGTFVASMDVSTIEIDDMRHPLPGTQEVTGQEARLTGTLVEINVANLQRILPMAHIDPNDEGLTMSSVLLPSHYLENVLWVGNKTNGDAIAILIHKALNTEGVTLTFTSSGGATMPFSYLAHQPDPNNVQYAPFKIWDLDYEPDTNGGGTDPDPDPGATDITLGTPLEGMTIQQMREFAAEQTPQIDIPSNLTLRQDIAEYILTELGLL
jgi:hypothetical protein